MKLWCHWHVSTSTSPHSFLLTPGSGCDKKMQHILFLTFHFSTWVRRIFSSHSHCLLFYFGLCDGHFKPPPVLPQTPSKHSWDSSAPLAVVSSGHPGGWGIKDGPLCISHSLQGNNQSLGVYREAGSHETNCQPHSGWSHLPVVSQGWKPHRHHFSIPKWQWILKGFIGSCRHD